MNRIQKFFYQFSKATLDELELSKVELSMNI